MQHPFSGVIQQDNTQPSASPERVSRRSALGQMLFAAGGLLGANAVAHAQPSTEAVGEEGGQPIKLQIQVSTAAVGEEGAVTQARNEEGLAKATTEPFGEEAGRVTSRFAPGLEDGGVKRDVNPVTDAVNENGGPVDRTKALNEEGRLLTKALPEEGRGMPFVVVPPLAIERDAKVLETVWTEMGASDPAKGLQGCAVLYGSKQAIAYLKDHLKVKVQQADEQTMTTLINQLDDDNFATRERAEKKLAELGTTAIPALQKASESHGSLEVRMRTKRLLEKFKEMSVLVQAERGLEVLVALQTPEAKELLTTIAKGDEKDWLAKTAKTILERKPAK